MVGARIWRAGALALVVVSLLAAVTGCSDDTAGDDTDASVTVPRNDSPAQAPEAGLKPQLAGVLDRQGMPRTRFLDQLDGFVLSVRWADLQPEPFGPLVADNAIDQAIAAVRAGPSHFRLKLRVNAGVHAPEALKEQTGGGVQIGYEGPNSFEELEGTVPRFWTELHREAYADLQRRLAAAYDDVPEIQQVVITQCMTFYAEPMLRQAGMPDSTRALLAAGYTAEADEDCHRSAIDAHHAWVHTRSSMAFNPYQVVVAGKGAQTDTALSIEMMEHCRSVLGERCVLENYSLAWPLREGGAGNYDAIYEALERLGPPLSFQTAAASRIGDWEGALAWAAEVGAASVELNRGYPEYDTDDLAALRARLKANLG